MNKTKVVKLSFNSLKLCETFIADFNDLVADLKQESKLQLYALCLDYLKTNTKKVK